MTKNPLALADHNRRVHWDLDDFCHKSNQYNFVRQSGRPYFITTKRDDKGEIVYNPETLEPVRYLDRNA